MIITITWGYIGMSGTRTSTIKGRWGHAHWRD